MNFDERLIRQQQNIEVDKHDKKIADQKKAENKQLTKDQKAQAEKKHIKSIENEIRKNVDIEYIEDLFKNIKDQFLPNNPDLETLTSFNINNQSESIEIGIRWGKHLDNPNSKFPDTDNQLVIKKWLDNQVECYEGEIYIRVIKQQKRKFWNSKPDQLSDLKESFIISNNSYAIFGNNFIDHTDPLSATKAGMVSTGDSFSSRTFLIKKTSQVSTKDPDWKEKVEQYLLNEVTRQFGN